MYNLIRIIGNALPPRHTSGQNLSNLRYILEHEEDFEYCDKTFVLNRLLDEGEKEAIIKLLEKHGKQYTSISIDWDLFDTDPVQALIGLNDARNLAIRQSLDKGYQVVLALDGNCFFNRAGWLNFETVTYNRPNDGYFALPMHRCKHLDELQGQPNFYEVWHTFSGGRAMQKIALTEPQLAFTNLSDIFYDPKFAYAKASKAHMFWKLGFPGIWDDWYPLERQQALQDRSKFYGQVRTAGWVYRLPSGVNEAEVDNKVRGSLRDTGIQNLIDKARNVKPKNTSI